MSRYIRVKKAFTLIELIIVILLISIVYLVLFSNINMNSEKNIKLKIDGIKEFMLKNFDFKNELAFNCIDNDGLKCYIFVDGKVDENIVINNLFEQKPKVYNYDRLLSDYEFSRIKFKNFEYEPFFELKINKDHKHKSLIVDTLDGKVYLFSPISKKVKKFNNTNEVLDMMYDNSIEVRDAF